MNEKVITTFGTAFIEPDDRLYEDISIIGSIIAEKGYITCCGGYYGTMESISKGANTAGGKTIGVTVKGWQNSPNEYLNEIIIKDNLMERITTLIGIAERYIIFRGGTGTLLEISATLELMNKKAMPEKMMIFYSDYWKSLIEVLKSDSEALRIMIEKNVKFIHDPEELKLLI